MDIASRLPEAKKGMPLDALWIYEFFKVLVCSLLLGVRVTMCCAGGGGGGSGFYTKCPRMLCFGESHYDVVHVWTC